MTRRVEKITGVLTFGLTTYKRKGLIWKPMN